MLLITQGALPTAPSSGAAPAQEGRQENKCEAANTRSNETEKGGVVVTGKEFGEYADIKELREKAVKYYAEYLQGTSVENKVLGKIDINENGIVNFTGSGKKEMQNSSAKVHKLLLVKYLPELIKNATDITGKQSVKPTHKKEHFYYIHTKALIEGKETPVEITLIRRNNGDIQYYNHILPTEEQKKTQSYLRNQYPKIMEPMALRPSLRLMSVRLYHKKSQLARKIIQPTEKMWLT